jgi:3-hydroxybutyryl-CoA dehydrogenase
VIRGPGTSDATIEYLFRLLTSLGKLPVEVKDTPGFLANRLQMALAREAMLCIADGLASAEDIDRLFTHSIGFRLVAAGPLAIADFGGLDVYLRVFDTLAQDIPERFEPPDVLKELVGEGRLGAKTGRGFLEYGAGTPSAVQTRDRRLLQLSRLLASPEWAADEGGE